MDGVASEVAEEVGALLEDDHVHAGPFRCEVIAWYSSPARALVLALGAGLCLVADRMMVRIGRLPEESQVLS